MRKFLTIALAIGFVWPVGADETRQSPYLAKIVGQEDFVYVWTLGVEGLGDGSDKLVTLGANPDRPGYGQVISTYSVGGRHGAHRAGFTDDRRQIWAGGLDDSSVFIFDVASDPAHPELIHRMDDFVALSGGVVGPHTFYALPGRMLVTGLSNKDGGGRTGLVEFSNRAEFSQTTWMPEGAIHGFDARVNTHINRMLTSSFTRRNLYSSDASATKDSGDTIVVWDYLARKPLQVLPVPGVPMEIRWALRPRHEYAFTTTALTSRLWGIFRREDGSFEAVKLAKVGDPDDRSLPVDISLSADDRFLFVNSFKDGTVRVFNVSKPREPKLVLEQRIGSKLGRVSQTWDGKRVYFTSSMLASWDASGEESEQFLKAFSWDGDDLEPLFELDFKARKLGFPHSMLFGSIDFYRGRVAAAGGGR